VDMNTQNFTITRGDTWERVIYFKDDDEVAIDITGWTIFFTVKEKVSDEDASAKISKTITTHTDPTNGESKITLTYTDTALTCKNYIYDLQVKTDEGEIKTLLEGVITIKQDITIRTS